MNSTFSKLMQALASQIPMKHLELSGQEMNRIARFTPDLDSKERLLYWRGEDPDEAEIANLVGDLICHLGLPKVEQT